MAKMRIEGSFVAPPTPFNEDGSVDFGAFRNNLLCIIKEANIQQE